MLLGDDGCVFVIFDYTEGVDVLSYSMIVAIFWLLVVESQQEITSLKGTSEKRSIIMSLLSL